MVVERIRYGARLAWVCVALLAGCGGGGGGDGGGDGSGSGGASLSVSTTSVSFAASQNGVPPDSQEVGVSIAGGSVFVGIFSVLGPISATFSITGDTTGVITIRPLAPTMVPGTYSGSVTVRGCPDQFCMGDVSGSPKVINVSYTIIPPIIATPNALSFSFITGGPAPAPQPITLVGTTGAWTSSANQPWIGVNPGNGTGDGGTSISADPSGLVPDTYSGQVIFRSGVGAVAVNIGLTVIPAAIQTNQSSLSFSGINGAPLASQSLTIAMNNGVPIAWTASTPLADTWLVLNRTSGTASDPLIVSANPANGPLASGTYNSSITLQGSSGGSTFNKTINVTLSLTKAFLTIGGGGVTLGGANGRDLSGAPIQLSLNTGANSFSWSSSNANATFAKLSQSSGSVSATPLALTLTPDRTGRLGGAYSGSIRFTVAVNGDSVSSLINVALNLDQHRLLVDGNGVAFAKTPSLSKLTQTLRVRDNFGFATPWTATPDQTWLTTTPGGTADGDLTLTADPTALSADTLYLATVTITSSDASVENTEKVRVGLWVGSTDPDPTTTISGPAFAEIAADPIRPYVYAAVGKSIQIFNVYTGAVVTSIPNATPVQTGAMTVSQDGSTLYALDTVLGSITPINLDTLSVGTAFPENSLASSASIAFTRTDGQPILFWGSGPVINASTSIALGGTPDLTLAPTTVAASRNGSRVCGADTGNGTYSLFCESLDYASFGINAAQLLTSSFARGSGSGVSAADIAVSADGSVAYVAAGASALPPELAVYSPQDVTRLGGFSIEGRGNNVDIAADGRIFAGSTNISVGQTADVRVFDAAGNLLATHLIAPGGGVVILDRQLKVSGDGLRLMTIIGNPPSVAPTLVFTTVAP
jgi:hypothetical protein